MAWGKGCGNLNKRSIDIIKKLQENKDAKNRKKKKKSN